MDTLVKFFAVYLISIVVLAVWLGWPDRRRRKRQKKELLSRLENIK